MAEFTPINTQEEFDKAIQARLERERSTISKKFEEDIKKTEKERDGYKSQIEGFQTSAKENAEKITDLETQLAEATKKASVNSRTGPIFRGSIQTGMIRTVLK